MGATPIGLLFGFKRVDAYATQKDLFKVRLQCPLAKKNQIISRIQPSKSRDATNHSVRNEYRGHHAPQRYS